MSNSIASAVRTQLEIFGKTGDTSLIDGMKNHYQIRVLIHLKESGNPGLIDGFTPEQRFFISWATIWRTKARDEAIKNLVKTDSHSPGQYRAYVPLQNVDAFYKAFNIQSGDGMYLSEAERVKIW